MGFALLESRQFIAEFVARYVPLSPSFADTGWDHQTGWRETDTEIYDVN